MISKPDLGKARGFAHTEGILQLGGRARHVIIRGLGDICCGLLAERGASWVINDTHV